MMHGHMNVKSNDFFRITGFNYVVGPMSDTVMFNWVEHYWKVANEVILV
jgi:uncharacterized membrane protein